MTKSLGVSIISAVIFCAIQAHAQFVGVPGAAVDPGYQNWGSGIYPMAQPCQYGGSVANPIDDDEGVIDAKDAADDAKQALRDAEQAAHDAHVDLHEKEIELTKALTINYTPSEDVSTFRADANACEQMVQNGQGAIPDGCSGAGGNLNQLTDSTQRHSAWICAIKHSSFSGSSSQAQCAHATENMNAGGAPTFDPGNMCLDPGDSSLKKDFPDYRPNTTHANFGACRSAAGNYLDAYKKSKAADDALAAAKKGITMATRNLSKAKSEAQRLLREQRQLNADEGDADSAGCPECAAYKRQQMSASTGINKTALILGLALGGGEIAAQSMVNLAEAHQNARLGYPTGPNPYAAAIGAGFPFIYGGIYGAVQGGMASGGFGCSPTSNGGFYGGGPWPGGMYGGMAYPYGGGMYMPGYGPGWGYAGPWGVNPYMMGPYAGVGAMGGYGMPGMGGYGMPGMGGYGMPGMGGYGMPGMGGYAGFGLGPGGFGAGAGFGMGGPYGPFGPGMGGFGMPGMGGFGMPGMGGMGGIGMGPFGTSPFGGPFAGMGGPYGMGPGGMGGPFMGGGMGGLYLQQMQMQIQSMMDYEHRLQLYVNTIGQASQLQQQAYQYLYGGGGMGGMGSMGGGFGGYGLGGFGSTGFGVSGGIGFGGGFGTSGVPINTPPILAPTGGGGR